DVVDPVDDDVVREEEEQRPQDERPVHLARCEETARGEGIGGVDPADGTGCANDAARDLRCAHDRSVLSSLWAARAERRPSHVHTAGTSMTAASAEERASTGATGTRSPRMSSSS